MVKRRSSVSRFDRGRHAVPLLRVIAATGAALFPDAVQAHGFGQRYELPLPLSLYLYGAAAVVALSFLVFGLFARRAPAKEADRQFDLTETPLGRVLLSPALRLALKLAALALFVVTLLAGLIGDQNPYRNIAPTLVWIVWWVGLVYVAAFAGDLWALINPWRTVFDAAHWLSKQLGGRGEPSFRLRYPPALGVWPACLLLMSFSWIELIYPNAAVPAHIAGFAIAYSVLTWAGMIAFGRDQWLRHGEVFSLFLGTFARFAPTEMRNGRLLVRPFGAGLLDDRPVSTSMIAFVLLLLATVLYDGLIGTGEWAELEGALLSWLPGSVETGRIAIRTIGLVAFWLLFLGAYAGITAVMSALAGGRPGALKVARRFAFTLVPIAIGYHVAHYLVFLLVQGQYIIPLLSDPFGYGWNLFGTAGYRVDIAVAGARFAWFTALGAIVAGHVLAVYLAHVRAMAVFAPARVALGTQVPLTALMVVYTFLGLSIMAEPITESRSAAGPVALATERVIIPEDALHPDAMAGLPRAGGPTARVRLTFKVMGSAFHDGTKFGIADLVYAYVFAYRWSVPGGEGGIRFDPYVAAATASLRRHLVAVRATGVDVASKSFRIGDVNFLREVFTVETFLTTSPDDPDWNAAVAPPWSTLPWHLIVLMEEAVARGWAAVSQSEAQRRGVPWLDLVRDKEVTARLANLAADFQREGYQPEALRGMVSVEEARKRWAALGAFYKANGHLLVTNGPYKLKAWTDTAATLEAFRDLTYPLGVGSYDAYATPRRGFITNTEWNNERLVLSADIEVIEKFQRSYRVMRMPIKSVPAATLKRAAPECRYIVTDTSARVVLAGTAPLGAEGNFQIDFGDRLPAGRYTLSAQIAVNGNVMNSEISRTEFSVPPGR